MSMFWISAIKKTEKIWHFCEFFHYYPTLDYHKIRTRTNFENSNGKNLDLHLIMWFTVKELLPDSTDFTEAIFKMPQISKHFSAMLPSWLLRKLTNQITWQTTLISHYHRQWRQAFNQANDKRDDFDFHIVNFPFLSSRIPSSPFYGVYISQLIRHARCCWH